MPKKKTKWKDAFIIHTIELSKEQIKFFSSTISHKAAYDYMLDMYQRDLKKHPKGWVNGNFSGGVFLGVEEMPKSKKLVLMIYTEEKFFFPALH